MDKEVLIHVRGLHMMEEDGEQEPVEIVVPGEYYFRKAAITCVTRKSWKTFPNLRSTT